MQAYLEDEGSAVTTAVDGEEGFTKAQQMLPDVVISDVMMPRLDGYGLLKELRADERLGGTPVIFLTAKGMTADRTQGYLAGVDDYIPKPFDPDELVARVRNVAQRQQRLQEAARFADTDMGQMAKQITEIRSLLAQAEALPSTEPVFTASRRGGKRAAAGGGRIDEQGNRPSVGDLHSQCGEVRAGCSTRRAPSRTELVRYALEHRLRLEAAAFNDGWTYRARCRGCCRHLVSEWLAHRYRHSDAAVWQQRIAAGELELNGAALW